MQEQKKEKKLNLRKMRRDAEIERISGFLMKHLEEYKAYKKKHGR